MAFPNVVRRDKFERLRGLNGSICPLATPYRNGRIDDDAFAFLCERQIQRGAAALSPLGIYGDAAGIDRADRARLIRLAVEVSRGRVPVIAGGGVNYTTIAVDLARQAEELGADGLLCAVPYYDQTTQDGLFRHFQAIQGATSLPVLIYDRPARRHIALATQTILRLGELPNIAGLADATCDARRAENLRAQLGMDFLLLCGLGGKVEDFYAAGGQGFMAVAANIVPGICRVLHEAWRGHQFQRCRDLAEILERLEASMAAATNPQPLSWALSSLGLSQDLRHPPLTMAEVAQEEGLREALDSAILQEGAVIRPALAADDRLGETGRNL